MTQRHTSLEQIFETQIRTLALALRPRTVGHYRTTARHFLTYLRATCPPTLALPKDTPSAGLPGIRQALEATRHLLEMCTGASLAMREPAANCSASTTVASQLEKIYTEAK